MGKTNSVLMGERLMKIETTLEYIKQKQDDNDSDHAVMIKKFDEFIEKADQRYASKLTEKVVYGLIGLIMSATIIAFMGLILI